MPILSINGDNYPETFANMIVVNAPAMFDSMFSVVKRLLPPETQKKIKVGSCLIDQGGIMLHEREEARVKVG